VGILVIAMAPPILIVDDDEDILELYKLILEDEGYRVDTAKNGKEAIEKALKESYYLALLDFVLPDIKGTEIATELCIKRKITKILFITGYSHIFDFIDPVYKQKCKVLLKPVSGETLIESVREALEPVSLYDVQEMVTTI
jgi:two-component system response regulator AtoC